MELEKLYEYEKYATLYKTLERHIDILHTMIVTIQQEGHVIINHFIIKDKESVDKILSGMQHSLCKFSVEKTKILQKIYNL